MGLKDIQPGEYVAKAVGMRYFESKARQTPGIQVAFEIETPNGPERINWNGWLSEGARARTAETLVEKLGYNGDENTDENGVFTNSSVLDWGRQVKLVLEINQAGYPDIKWINSLGGAKFAKTEPIGAKAGLAKSGFKSAIIAAKQKAGIQVQPVAPSGPKKEVPF